MKKNIIKVKRFQKPLICLVVMLLMVFSFIIGKITNANADEINYEYQSNNIGYDSTNSSLNADNVKDALDELYEKVGQCPKGQFCSTSEELVNKFGGSGNFVSAYTYDENSCVTGSESGCIKNNCYKSGTCPVGTIIDYFVNNSTVLRFHVLHDDGETMTLQAQKNTVYNTSWNSSNNVSDGPIKIMAALKKVTNGWNNVLDITLADGMTEFNDGISANNNCTETSCSLADSSGGYYYSKLVNSASIGSAVKARMITITETALLGCTAAGRSCPIYLYNYLSSSERTCKVIGKCTNDTHTENSVAYNYAYWTMSSASSTTAWIVYSEVGDVHQGSILDPNIGARAVVVVNK